MWKLKNTLYDISQWNQHRLLGFRFIRPLAPFTQAFACLNFLGLPV
jgi:hypothetical protein